MNKTITKVIPLAGYCLYLEMGSGGKLELDFSGLLDNIRFCELKDKDVFDSVSVEKRSSFWCKRDCQYCSCAERT